MEMKCRARVKEVKKKTKAEMFKNLQVGDIVRFSVHIGAVGSHRGRTYATCITCRNERTDEYCNKSFNEIERFIGLFDFEEIKEGE